MNQPASISVSQKNAREVTLEDVLEGAGVSPGNHEPVLGHSDATFSVEKVLEEQMDEFRQRSLASNTRRGYASDWRDFAAWCEGKGRASLPADVETTCLYFVDRSAELSKATMARRIAANSRTHLEDIFANRQRCPADHRPLIMPAKLTTGFLKNVV